MVIKIMIACNSGSLIKNSDYYQATMYLGTTQPKEPNSLIHESEEFCEKIYLSEHIATVKYHNFNEIPTS